MSAPDVDKIGRPRQPETVDAFSRQAFLLVAGGGALCGLCQLVYNVTMFTRSCMNEAVLRDAMGINVPTAGECMAEGFQWLSKILLIGR